MGAKRDQLDKDFDKIIIEIAENSSSLINAIQGKMSTATFYVLLQDEEKLKKYARATEIRSDKMAEDILTISDNISGDVIIIGKKKFIDHAVVQRDRLRVDARKWLLSKMHPKKYGEKIDMTSGNEPLKSNLNIIVDNSETVETLKKLRDELGKAD